MKENQINIYKLNNENDMAILKDKEFVIPFFQREYTWEIENIKALIDDGQDKLYIGNIVVQNGLIIDGQQRLTSLYLLSKFVGKECFKIRYELDDGDNKKLENLNHGNFTKTEFEMKNLNFICHFIEKNYSNTTEITNCLNNIYFTITELSSSIDAGRYFEAINTNKQQLKQHEILKAKFVEKLSKAHLDVAKIWDYCSDMNSYFMEDSKDDVLVKFEIKKIDDFTKDIAQNDTEITINDILKSNDLFLDNEQNKEKNYEVKSIVKFETFLCIVAKIIGVEDMPLETKHLVKNFEEKILDNEEKSDKFIRALFKYRNIFDKFIFKRSVKNEHIQAFGDKNLLMAQLLFEVQGSNEWLVKYLKFSENNENIQGHIDKLEKMDNSKAKDHNDKNLDNGTSVARYWFYRLEYILWKELDNKEGNVWNGVKNKENLKNNYILTGLNSVEHIQPRSKADENGFGGNDEKGSEKIDNFGNLALLSSSRNSSLSNLEVNEKKAKVENWLKGKQSIQSLKMILALNNGDWTFENATKHKEDMTDLLFSGLENNQDIK